MLNKYARKEMGNIDWDTCNDYIKEIVETISPAIAKFEQKGKWRVECVVKNYPPSMILSFLPAMVRKSVCQSAKDGRNICSTTYARSG